MNTIFRIIAFFILVIFFSCNEENTTEQPIKYDSSKLEDTLARANKYLLERDKELINSYLQRRNWKVDVTGAGLWYDIYEKSNGQKIKSGDIVKYNYRLELLDGTLCYSSEKDSVAQIKIGQSGKESGLEKGLILMRVGEKAHFILPPYMAHGLVGDMKKIPSRSIIVYDVEVLEVVDF